MSKDEQILGLYPDLSDQEDNPSKIKKTDSNSNQIMPNSQPRKIIKPNQNKQADQNNKIPFKAPLLFGGKNFFPPPPPPSGSHGHSNLNSYKSQFKAPISLPIQQAPKQHHQAYINPNQMNVPKNLNTYYQKTYEQNSKPERQRRNCVYVKNLPNYYLDNERLNTFFKNEGPIKEIKTNPEDNSAIVRFVKEEHAIKFVNSKKPIFNRSFIVYGLNQNIQISGKLIDERKYQQAGKVRRPLEVEMKQLKQRSETLFANKIRALLFLIKNIEEVSCLEKLRADLTESIMLKNQIVNFTNLQEFQVIKNKINNEFSWTLIYQTSRNAQNQKKSMLFDLQKKFGPISEIQVTSIDYYEYKRLPFPKMQGFNGNNNIETQNSEYYRVKISFLGIKSSWKFYYMKYLDKSSDELDYCQDNLNIEGTQLRNLFNSGIIKKPDIQLPKTAKRVEEVKPQQENQFQLVEILLSGDVKPMTDNWTPFQPQINCQVIKQAQKMQCRAEEVQVDINNNENGEVKQDGEDKENENREKQE